MSVALGLQPNQALLNDANPHLINFYRWVQSGLVIDSAFLNNPDYYYSARKRFNQLIESGSMETKEAAELFYYLNRTGYNGLCRFNQKGLFNVPFGRYKTINYAKDFLELKDFVSGWEFISTDFEDIAIEDGDFVYADPPYDVEFTAYSKNGFNWADQTRVAEWLADLKAPVIVSNQATKRILELYKSLGFKTHIISAPRRISSTGDRAPAKEMLAHIRLDW